MENMLRSCCFTGHRVLRSSDMPTLEADLEDEIRRLCGLGITNFISGGALGFDLMAAETVLRLRDELGITLSMMLPCENQAERWTDAQRSRYEAVLRAADSVEYISREYTPYCMQTRNRAMVDASEHCIAYMYRSFGGTFSTVRYVNEQDKGLTLLV